MRSRVRHITAAALRTGMLAAMGGCGMDMSPLAGMMMGARQRQPSVLVEMPDRNAFDKGVALASDLRYAEAEAQFAKVLAWYEATGDTKRAAETMFWLAFCHEKQGRIVRARKLYGRVIKEHAKAPAARQAADRMERLANAKEAGDARPRPPTE